MVFIWPLSLVGLIAAAAVAAWALIRPGRQEAIVGSLAVWQKALASLDRSAKRSSRRISAAWLMLLAGAVAGLLGLARPVFQTAGQARDVAVSLAVSAELGPQGLADMTAAARRLLGRLGVHDRVRLVLPAELGGSSSALSPAEAGERIAKLPLLAAAAADLSMPVDPQDVQHVYRFVPACLAAPLGGLRPAGPKTTVIAIGDHLADLTIDAIGAVSLPPGAGGQSGQVELYVAVRNNADSPLAARVRVEALQPDLAGWRSAGEAETVVAAGGRGGLIFRAEAGEAIRAVLTTPPALGTQGQGTILDSAQVARVGAARRKVAIIGRDEPLLRRFIQADRALELVGAAGEADLIFANLAEPPPDKPAMVIDPPGDPPGWRRGQLRRAVTLADANVAADDPLLARVNLSSVAVRRVRPWTRLDASALQPLVSIDGGAVILASPWRAGGSGAAGRGPAGQGGVGGGGVGGGGPARIYVAFELSGDNTNLGTSEAFVVLLANAAGSLAPPGATAAAYEYAAPIQAPRLAGWKRISQSADSLPEQVKAYAAGPPWPACPAGAGLPAPGVYLDQAGRVRAISLVGLRAAPQSGAAPPPTDSSPSAIAPPSTIAPKPGSAPAPDVSPPSTISPKPGNAPAPADGLQAVAAAPLPQPRVVGAQLELWPLLAAAALALWLAGWAMRMR